MFPVDPAHDPLSAPNAAAARARTVIEGQVALLTRLARIGMEIAEACGRQAVAQAQTSADASSPAAQHDASLAFARVARAVRMTIALQSRLLKDLAALDRDDACAQAALKVTRRMRLSRLVDQAAEAAIIARRDPADAIRADWNGDSLEDEIEHLASEAYERLTDAEDDAEFEDRPFAEVVARICGDLGLSPDWTARLLASARPTQPAGGAATAPRTQSPAANRPDPDPAPDQHPGVSVMASCFPSMGVWSGHSGPWSAKPTEGVCHDGPLHHAARDPPPP